MEAAWNCRAVISPSHLHQTARVGRHWSQRAVYSLIMLFQTLCGLTRPFICVICIIIMLMNCGLSTEFRRWSMVSIKVICIWSLHHPRLQRQQLLWSAGMNTSKCMWLNIVSYYCLLGDSSEVNSESLFSLNHFELHIRGKTWNQMLLVFGLSHGKLFKRFISNSYPCQADLKLWNFRNVWFSPEPSSNQTELKLSTTCVQSNTCWLLRNPLQSGHVHLRLFVFLIWLGFPFLSPYLYS